MGHEDMSADLPCLLCFYTRVSILNLMLVFLPGKLWINCINLNVKRDITMLWKFDGLWGKFNKDVRTAEHCWCERLIHFHGIFSAADWWDTFIDFFTQWDFYIKSKIIYIQNLNKFNDWNNLEYYYVIYEVLNFRLFSLVFPILILIIKINLIFHVCEFMTIKL